MSSAAETTNYLLAIIIGLLVGIFLLPKVHVGGEGLAWIVSGFIGFMEWSVSNWFITIPATILAMYVWVRYGFHISYLIRGG